MDSRIAHPHGHNYDQDPHNAAPHPAVAPQGEDEHAHERKSVIKKVKAKAKKIKDTLKKHGHRDEHDHDYQRTGQHIPDDHDLDEEDDDNEEIIEDPEVHGASEERYDTKIIEPITVSHSPGVYGIKAPDPTGTASGDEVAGITPVLQSFVKMNVHDEPDPKSAGVADHNLPILTRDHLTKLPSTGSHDQFSPEPVPPEAKAIRDKPQLPESFDTTKQQNHPHEMSGKPSNQSSYSEKISSATSAIADKAISATNAVASKLGYGEKVHGTSNESECGVKGQDKGVSVKDYVLEKLRPGDEDRALSELISDALHKQRREEPEKEKDTRPVGKVTESKEVARRLGTKDESHGERTQSSYLDSQGKGAVDKLKGTVIGSWLGLGGESQSQDPQQPHGDDGISNAGERKLQEN